MHLTGPKKPAQRSVAHDVRSRAHQTRAPAVCRPLKAATSRPTLRIRKAERYDRSHSPAPRPRPTTPAVRRTLSTNPRPRIRSRSAQTSEHIPTIPVPAGGERHRDVERSAEDEIETHHGSQTDERVVRADEGDDADDHEQHRQQPMQYPPASRRRDRGDHHLIRRRSKTEAPKRTAIAATVP